MQFRTCLRTITTSTPPLAATNTRHTGARPLTVTPISPARRPRAALKSRLISSQGGILYISLPTIYHGVVAMRVMFGVIYCKNCPVCTFTPIFFIEISSFYPPPPGRPSRQSPRHLWTKTTCRIPSSSAGSTSDPIWNAVLLAGLGTDMECCIAGRSGDWSLGCLNETSECKVFSMDMGLGGS